MAQKINTPTRIASEGNKPKIIEEYVGRVNTGTAAVSIARMVAPAGWHEPGQRPAFDEYTVVIEGCLVVETEAGTLRVVAGEAILSEAGEWVRYRTADDQGAVYLAVCLPAFSPETVQRDG